MNPWWILRPMEIKNLNGIAYPIALVVDDEPLIRMDTADIISEAGYHVIEAASADEALKFIEDYGALALLFTDVNTGGDIDGFELARTVTERWPETQIVVASGERLPRDEDMPRNARFIRKPFAAHAVLEALQEQRKQTMKVRKFSFTDANLVRSPGQDGDIYVGNLVDERHGGPITIGYGRYAPDQTLTETMAVDDVMIVLEGQLAVSTGAGTVTAGPGDIVYMPKGEAVTISTNGEGALTAYVTYPHWAVAHD